MVSKLVKTQEQIVWNVKLLANSLLQNNLKQVDGANYSKELLRRGHNFVGVRISSSEVIFAPSRFVGYINNNPKAHMAASKHGGSTDVSISKILNEPIRKSDDSRSLRGAAKANKNTWDKLEKAFLQFCKSVRVSPYRFQRDYWLIDLSETLTTTTSARDGKRQETALAYASASLATPESLKELLEDLSNIPPGSTDRDQFIKARVGQGKFRAGLVKIWKGRCAVTGCGVSDALRASHIIRWRDSNDHQRLDPNNGLLLLAGLDALFDRHLISFHDDGGIAISTSISLSDQMLLSINTQMKLRISLNEIQKEYLTTHRNVLGNHNYEGQA